MNNPISLRILVVDDEPKTCAYIARVLRQRNWQVDTACDGASALELVGRSRYDAAVLDYRMPDMNGAELCRAIDQRQPGIPKILLTGYPTIDTVYPAVQAGIDRVLAKPVNLEELVGVVESQIQ